MDTEESALDNYLYLRPHPPLDAGVALACQGGRVLAAYVTTDAAKR